MNDYTMFKEDTSNASNYVTWNDIKIGEQQIEKEVQGSSVEITFCDKTKDK